MSGAAVRPTLPADDLPGGRAPAVVAPPSLPDAARAAAPSAERPPVVLDVQDLRTFFFTYEGVVRALDGVSFQLRHGETTGLVGETGCGKSVTALSISRLVPDPPGRIFGGKILLGSVDLLHGLASEATFQQTKGSRRIRIRRSFRRIRAANARMEAVRGRRIAMIFQEPSQALNPVFSIANQVGEILFLHHGPAIIDAMFAATPQAPGVGPALEAVVAAGQGRDRLALRAAADALGAAAHSSRLATEAFYLGQGTAGASVQRRQLQDAIRRLRLGRGHRHYLAHRKRLAVLREQLNQVHLAELGGDRTVGPQARRLARRRFRERLTHCYYGIVGVARWARGPLDRELFWRVVRSLEGVRIANPSQVARGYPHELSGGMIQRVMIAMALSGEPDVLLADEPTTALDVTIQAQILELLEDLRRRVGTAILLITHDLAVVAEVADRVCVMYAGQIIEQAAVRDLFERPLHPYTQGLLASVPRIDQPEKSLKGIGGYVPDLIAPPSGCRFHPRCPHAMPVCKVNKPPTTDEGAEHTVACYLYHGPVVGK